MKKFILLTPLFLLLQISLSAQKNFTDGGLIQWNGDTIRGQIDYQEWDISPENIQFRQSVTGETSIFTPQNIAGFFVSERNEMYQTATVYLNNEPPNERNFPDFSSVGAAIREFSPIRDTVFLRVLAKGQLNLFEYSDKNRQHFLAQPAGDTIRELIFRKVKVNGKLLQLDEYRKQLQMLSLSCPTLKVDFDKLPYYEKDLLEAVRAFNQCRQNSVYTRPAEKSGKFFYAMAGAVLPFFELSGPFVSLNSHDEKYTLTGLGPMLGVGCDFNFARARGRRGVGIEMLAAQYSLSHGAKDFFERDVNYEVDMGYVRMLGYFRQNLTTGKVSPYVKVGAGGSYYFKSEVSHSTEPSSLESIRPTKKGDVCLMGGVGVRVKRFFAETRFEWGSNLAEFDASDNLKANFIALAVGYQIFNKTSNTDFFHGNSSASHVAKQ